MKCTENTKSTEFIFCTNYTNQTNEMYGKHGNTQKKVCINLLNLLNLWAKLKQTRTYTEKHGKIMYGKAWESRK